jgi:hypothetical protein
MTLPMAWYSARAARIPAYGPPHAAAATIQAASHRASRLSRAVAARGQSCEMTLPMAWYSARAARIRWRIAIAVPSSAARNAARNAAFLM